MLSVRNNPSIICVVILAVLNACNTEKEVNVNSVGFCMLSEDSVKVEYLESINGIGEVEDTVSGDTLILNMKAAITNLQIAPVIRLPEGISIIKVQERIFRVSDIDTCHYSYSVADDDTIWTR